MPAPKPIEKPNQLLVEGRDTEGFLLALLRNMGLTQDIQVQDFGGINELSAFIRAVRSASSTGSSLLPNISSIGIIRDAESSPANAFRSVCGSLNSAGLTEPSQIGTFEGSSPKVGIFILPDPATNGMLEDLCLRSVEECSVLHCIDEYFSCLEQVNSLPKNISKAKVQAFLASRPEYIAHLGLAAQKGYWPWDHAAFSNIKKFLIGMVKAE